MKDAVKVGRTRGLTNSSIARQRIRSKNTIRGAGTTPVLRMFLLLLLASLFVWFAFMQSETDTKARAESEGDTENNALSQQLKGKLNNIYPRYFI